MTEETKSLSEHINEINYPITERYTFNVPSACDVRILSEHIGNKSIPINRLYYTDVKDPDTGKITRTGKIRTLLLSNEEHNFLNERARIVSSLMVSPGTVCTNFDEMVYFNSVSTDIDIDNDCIFKEYTFIVEKD